MFIDARIVAAVNESFLRRGLKLTFARKNAQLAIKDLRVDSTSLIVYGLKKQHARVMATIFLTVEGRCGVTVIPVNERKSKSRNGTKITKRRKK